MSIRSVMTQGLHFDTSFRTCQHLRRADARNLTRGTRAEHQNRWQNRTFTWEPVCTWEPLLGNLYLGTFAWEPLLGNLYLGTLAWELLLGGSIYSFSFYSFHTPSLASRGARAKPDARNPTRGTSKQNPFRLKSICHFLILFFGSCKCCLRLLYYKMLQEFEEGGLLKNTF